MKNGKSCTDSNLSTIANCYGKPHDLLNHIVLRAIHHNRRSCLYPCEVSARAVDHDETKGWVDQRNSMRIYLARGRASQRVIVETRTWNFRVGVRPIGLASQKSRCAFLVAVASSEKLHIPAYHIIISNHNFGRGKFNQQKSSLI